MNPDLSPLHLTKPCKNPAWWTHFFLHQNDLTYQSPWNTTDIEYTKEMYSTVQSVFLTNHILANIKKEMHNMYTYRYTNEWYTVDMCEVHPLTVFLFLIYNSKKEMKIFHWNCIQGAKISVTLYVNKKFSSLLLMYMYNCRKKSMYCTCTTSN